MTDSQILFNQKYGALNLKFTSVITEKFKQDAKCGTVSLFLSGIGLNLCDDLGKADRKSIPSEKTHFSIGGSFHPGIYNRNLS